MYEPNFNDPRVIKRCKRALGFAFGMLSANKPREYASRSIDKYFGQGQHPLSQYLKAQLLIIEDPHYKFGDLGSQCKTYLLDHPGAMRLYSDLYPSKSINKQREYNLISESVTPEFNSQLHSGKFEYKHKSNRQWHPLQNLRSEPRKHIFNSYGYSHIYDIRACAPTLIAHLASAYAPKHTITVKRMNHTFDKFLCDIKGFRQHVADVANTEYSTAKKLINSLFAGANLGCNVQYDTYKMLDYNFANMHALQQDAELSELRTAISKAWKLIRVGEQIELPKGKRMTSSNKWSVYFKYENLIMSVVSDYLDREYVRYFKEHDGWSCDVQLDLEDLVSYLRARTGINTLQIEHEAYNNR